MGPPGGLPTAPVAATASAGAASNDPFAVFTQVIGDLFDLVRFAPLPTPIYDM
jgi:hypothetical protein